jgi:uncharacterized repeat protein (TIGR01451 family)
MAGPHVAGTVALLWSAAHGLIGDVDATESVIAHTARPKTTTESCGGDGVGDVPNNVYGWGVVDALRAVRSTLWKAEVVKQVAVPSELWVRSLDYSLFVTNISPFTLTNLVLTDTVPLSTAFVGASGSYAYDGHIVTWTASSLDPWGVLTAELKISVDHLPRGQPVINADYGVGAKELLTPIAGAPVEAIIPWRHAVPTVLKNARLDGRDDG